MKKRILLVLCVLACVVLFAGCAQEQEPFTQSSYTPENAQISGIVVDVRDRQVDVVPSADGKIHVEYYENSKEYYDISVSGDNVLMVKAVTNKGWTDFVGVKAPAEARKITLHVPEAILGSLEISTTNEDISVAPLSLSGSVTLRDNGGNISFDGLEAGEAITLAVKNGNISGQISGSYDDFAISCTIKKGDSNLPDSKESGSKKLTVTANNGDVEIEIL